MSHEIAFILPQYGKFEYSRRAALSFFKYTDSSSVVLLYDDASPDQARFNFSDWRREMPEDRVLYMPFPVNGGLTRSWNAGLRLARVMACRYTICGNSDVLFTPGWEYGLRNALMNGLHMVGPVTNAPGPTNGNAQNVSNFYPRYEVRSDRDYLATVAGHLRQHYPLGTIYLTAINGFFMMAETGIWWSGAFDSENVFDPKHKMVGNEDELQGRWLRAQRVIGFTPTSFVFHFRAVTRGRRHLATGWHRLTPETQHEPV